MNLKLSDFFNVFNVKMAAKAVIKNKKKGIATLCIGGGQGVAMCVERK